MQQLIRAVARLTDPRTSHEAAKSIGDLRPKQRAVLAALRYLGPSTDAHLVEDYPSIAYDGDLPPQSESGIRTRRSELVKLGLVKAVGSTRLESGRLGTIWQVVHR